MKKLMGALAGAATLLAAAAPLAPAAARDRGGIVVETGGGYGPYYGRPHGYGRPYGYGRHRHRDRNGSTLGGLILGGLLVGGIVAAANASKRDRGYPGGYDPYARDYGPDARAGIDACLAAAERGADGRPRVADVRAGPDRTEVRGYVGESPGAARFSCVAERGRVVDLRLTTDGYAFDADGAGADDEAYALRDD